MSADMVPLATTFSIVFLAEIGDKTQLTAMTLSSKSSAITVFVAAMSAFLMVDGVSAMLGGELLRFLPSEWVAFSSGIVFLLFGAFSLIRRNQRIKVANRKTTFLQTFSLVSLMELGDKTQIASIVLAAEFKSSLIVLAGVMLAFLVATGIGVICGSKILRLLPERYLKIGTSLLFLFFGFVFILDAITGTLLL